MHTTKHLIWTTAVLLVALLLLPACDCEQDPTQSIQTISATDAVDMFIARSGDSDFVVLDVRTYNEFVASRLFGAVNIDYYSSSFRDNLDAFDKTTDYLVYCNSGSRSGLAVAVMEDLGFLSVYNVDGGFDGMQAIAACSQYLTSGT